MSAKVERATHTVEHGRDIFAHECFWADEHEHYGYDGECLGRYRHAITCAHGLSVRHEGFRRRVVLPPTDEEVRDREIQTKRRLGQ